MTQILNLEPVRFSTRAQSALAKVAEYVAAPNGADLDDLAPLLANAQVIWSRLGYQLDEAMLARAPKLRAVVTPTTGITHVDTAALKERGIALLCLKGHTAFLDQITSTAELTWGLILELHRTLAAAGAHVRAGGWDRDQFRGNQLTGRTLGIIGMGRLGRIVASYAHAFRMQVLFTDVREVAAPAPAQSVPLDTLLQRADIVSLHAALTPASRRMIGYRELELMRHGAMLINTARGELIDEVALVAAIDAGYLAGVALDVLADEHSIGALGTRHPLIARAGNQLAAGTKLVITPHIGGACHDAMAQTEEFMSRVLIDWLSENSLINLAGDPAPA